jgi:hypothetical protein
MRRAALSAAAALFVGLLPVGLLPVWAHAVAGPAAAAGVQTVTLQQAVTPGATLAKFSAAPGLFRLRVRGGHGEQVGLAAGSLQSAPATLNGYWQTLGLLVSAADSVALTAVSALPAGTRIDVAPAAASGNLSTSGPSVTTASGKQILVDNTALVFKGYSYGPQWIGDQFLSPTATWADPPTCQKDAVLMAAAGVTAVRIAYDENEAALHDQYIQCLNSFAANGIGVVWLINGTGGVEASVNNAGGAAWLAAYQQRVSAAISALGAHPATLLWIIGNEISDHNGSASEIADSYYWYGCAAGAGCGATRVGAVDGLLAAAQAADPKHLSGVTIDDAPGRLSTANLPHLQFWGLNHYFPAAGAGTWFTDINVDARPKLLTEFGTDRYRCPRGKAFVPNKDNPNAGISVSCATVAGNPGASAGEDQQPQADWDGGDWDVIQANLAPSSGAGSVVGGVAFMFSDLWSFSLGVFWPGSPVNHDVAGEYGSGFTANNFPDGMFNSEWQGVSVAQLPGATETRMTTLAFDAMARRWAVTAPPTLSNLQFTVTGLLNAQVSWTTSEPATTEVQFAYCDTPHNGQDIVSDDGIYHYPNPINGAPNPALTTSHSVQVGISLGEPVRVAVRSFTGDGRSVTAAPFDVGWTTTSTSTCLH